MKVVIKIAMILLVTGGCSNDNRSIDGDHFQVIMDGCKEVGSVGIDARNIYGIWENMDPYLVDQGDMKYTSLNLSDQGMFTLQSKTFNGCPYNDDTLDCPDWDFYESELLSGRYSLSKGILQLDSQNEAIQFTISNDSFPSNFTASGLEFCSVVFSRT